MIEHLAFKRVYVDLPAATHKRLQEQARASGLSMKAYLTKLIEQARPGSVK